MAERLAAIADAADAVSITQAGTMVFGTNQPHLIPVLRTMNADTQDPLARFSLRTRLADQLLQAGASQEALMEFEALQATLAALPDSAVSAVQRAQEAARLHGAIGVAALRLGEQQNCVLNHRAARWALRAAASWKTSTATASKTAPRPPDSSASLVAST